MHKLAHTSPDIIETSGLAQIDGQLFTINDSGDTSRVYIINVDGETENTFILNGAQNRDWEALASNGDTLFIGDVGNNFKWKDTLQIFIAVHKKLAGIINFNEYPYVYLIYYLCTK